MALALPGDVQAMSELDRVALPRNRQPAVLIDELLELLAAPRQSDFYNTYASLVRELCRAEAVAVLEVRADDPSLSSRLGQAGAELDVQALVEQYTPQRWMASESQGFTHDGFRKTDGLGSVLLLLRLRDALPSVLLLSLPERDRAHLKEALVRALLVKDLRSPVVSAAVGSSSDSMQAPQGLLGMLDLATEVLQAPRFGAAALTLVNGAVRTLKVRQAVLCWRMASDAEVVAVSHIDKFESTSRLVMAYRAAAAEVLATDQVISFAADTAPDEGTLPALIPPAHQALLGVLDDIRHVVSLPMRDASGLTQAVLILLSDEQPVAQEDINQALLLLELVYPRLADSRVRDASSWRRLRMGLLSRLELLVGPGHPWAKLGALSGSVLLLVMLFVEVPYRVEATAQLTTDSTRLITSQNDGRLLEVLVDVGDTVRQGQVLARLDTADLLQQKAEVLSEIKRYEAEEDKARASGALAEMQVARARRMQSQARLERVTHFLEQALSEAPFDGVVVEGERRHLVGASVKRGDKLFRIAQVKDLYVMLQVPEDAIRSLSGDAPAHLRLLSQPDQPIRLQVSAFVPMAQVKGEEGNHFLLKAKILDEQASWWRPGMTGLAKIEAGSRNITWVLLHRLMDKLRLWLWW